MQKITKSKERKQKIIIIQIARCLWTGPSYFKPIFGRNNFQALGMVSISAFMLTKWPGIVLMPFAFIFCGISHIYFLPKLPKFLG